MVAYNTLRYSPYVIVLFLDALRSQSTPFRLATLVLYITLEASKIIQFGYILLITPSSTTALRW